MLSAPSTLPEKSRLAILLEHFATIDDPRDVRRITHPLAEILLLVVCGTIADCDDYDHIAAWGETHLDFLRRHLPYDNGVPGGGWLTILMNRINPALFSAVFTAWVRGTWPDRLDFVAIDGKTSRRSHDRATGGEPIHLVSAFATTARLMLGQEAVPNKANELTAIPLLLARLAEQDGCTAHWSPSIPSPLTPGPSATLAPTTCWRSRPTGQAFAPRSKPTSTPPQPDRCGPTPRMTRAMAGIEQRTVSVVREVEWLSGERRFPGELRLPDVAYIVRVHACIERSAKRHEETRYYIASAILDAPTPARPYAAIGASRTACTGCWT